MKILGFPLHHKNATTHSTWDFCRVKCFKVKCCFAGSYPQQAVYPQQSTAPVYPPAMQMSPQAPPYTDTPPAYSEVTIAFK